jgi:CheY-like chemotaxis protein
MSMLGRILLVEDDPKDVELTLTALEEYHLANEVVVTRDGEFVNAVRELGIFWAIINAPPPGSIKAK